MDSDDVEGLRRKAQKVLKSMISAYIQFPKLLIAVVNGPCIGIAATTAALCDIVYASDNVSENFIEFLISALNVVIHNISGLFLHSLYIVGFMCRRFVVVYFPENSWHIEGLRNADAKS